MILENNNEKEKNSRKGIKKLASIATALFMTVNMSSILKTSGAYAEGIKTDISQELNEESIFDKYSFTGVYRKEDLDNKRIKDGSFIDDFTNVNGVQYDAYVVKEGDNSSRISEKICRHNGVEVSTKYWPVLAYLNQYPRVIKPSDVIIFLDSTEDMDELLAGLKSSNWYSKYVQYYDIRKNAKKNITVGEVLDDIYGKGTSKDSAFVKRYLKTIGLDSNNYNAGTELNNYTYFRLTEWIPTTEELGLKSNTAEKTKTK